MEKMRIMEKARILVIDDEPEVVEAIKHWLEVNHYEVITALDGESGLGKAMSEKPDLIILDILMPGTDGYQVLKQLKAKRVTRQMPVLMLTAKGETDSILKSKELRATDYFIKPVNLEKLQASIRKYLGIRWAEEPA